MTRVFTITALLLTTSLFAQKDVGNWVMYFGMNKVHKDWSIHTEAQWRNHTIKPKLEQLLLRTGVNYHINKKHMVTLGYGYILSQPEDFPTQDRVQEHRIFQQYIMKNEVWRFFFEHRYRYEQRFIEQDFKQRLRYRLMFAIPFNKKRIEKGAVFFSLYDEVFINIERNNYFDRNRFYLALGYQIVKFFK